MKEFIIGLFCVNILAGIILWASTSTYFKRDENE